MPPNQNQLPSPTPGPQPDQTPYDFFMSPEPQKKGFSFGGGSFKQKLIILGGAAFAILLVIIVVSAISSGGKKDSTPLLSVAQVQQEIVRVTADGAKNAKSTKLKNFAVTTGLSVTSDQLQLLAFLKAHGVKPKTATLDLGKNPQTDLALAAALAANTYDTTFTSTMQSELDTYQAKLEAASGVATLKTEKALLQKQTDSAALLRKQLNL